MIAKELRDVWWKFLVASVPVLALAFVLPNPYAESVEIVRHVPKENAVDIALRDVSDLYVIGGLFILLPLAALLGVALISGETDKGTISMLLSRPVSRARILLSKYAVGAGTLLLAAVLGKALLLGLAAWRGNPVGQITVADTVLSTLLMWLGVLSILGISLLVSVVLRSVLASIVVCASVLFLILWLPSLIASQLSPIPGYYLSLRLTLYHYWMSADYFFNPGADVANGGGFTVTNFLVCLIAAVVPLLAALWLFDRKEY